MASITSMTYPVFKINISGSVADEINNGYLGIFETNLAMFFVCEQSHIVIYNIEKSQIDHDNINTTMKLFIVGFDPKELDDSSKQLIKIILKNDRFNVTDIKTLDVPINTLVDIYATYHPELSHGDITNLLTIKKSPDERINIVRKAYEEKKLISDEMYHEIIDQLPATTNVKKVIEEDESIDEINSPVEDVHNDEIDETDDVDNEDITDDTEVKENHEPESKQKTVSLAKEEKSSLPPDNVISAVSSTEATEVKETPVTHNDVVEVKLISPDPPENKPQDVIIDLINKYSDYATTLKELSFIIKNTKDSKQYVSKFDNYDKSRISIKNLCSQIVVEIQKIEDSKLKSKMTENFNTIGMAMGPEIELIYCVKKFYSLISDIVMINEKKYQKYVGLQKDLQYKLKPDLVNTVNTVTSLLSADVNMLNEKKTIIREKIKSSKYIRNHPLLSVSLQLDVINNKLDTTISLINVIKSRITDYVENLKNNVPSDSINDAHLSGAKSEEVKTPEMNRVAVVTIPVIPEAPITDSKQPVEVSSSEAPRSHTSSIITPIIVTNIKQIRSSESRNHSTIVDSQTPKVSESRTINNIDSQQNIRTLNSKASELPIVTKTHSESKSLSTDVKKTESIGHLVPETSHPRKINRENPETIPVSHQRQRTMPSSAGYGKHHSINRVVVKQNPVSTPVLPPAEPKHATQPRSIMPRSIKASGDGKSLSKYIPKKFRGHVNTDPHSVPRIGSNTIITRHSSHKDIESRPVKIQASKINSNQRLISRNRK